MTKIGTSKKSGLLPCIAGTLCVLILFSIGLVAQVFTAMWRDFYIDPQPIPHQIVSLIHWAWTLPLGIVIAAALIFGSRRWSRRVTTIVSLLIILLAIVMLLAFVASLYSRPIRGIGIVGR